SPCEWRHWPDGSWPGRASRRRLASVSEQHGDRIPERLMDDLLRRDDHVLAGRLAQGWPDTSRALSLFERWRDRIAAGADDEVADRWLELMRNAEHARAEA